jgi:hypothetical protein
MQRRLILVILGIGLIGIIVVALEDKPKAMPRRVEVRSVSVAPAVEVVREVSREDQMLDVYSYAYDATGKLSKGDFRQIVKFELLAADWNAALTPMVKGLRDPGMVPEEWARSARRYLNEAEMIKVKMGIAAAQVEDSSARSIVKQIADINSQMFVAWEDVRQAMANGDNDAYRRAGMRAQGLAQEKANVAGPVLRRLREKLGDKVVDGALERELRELARKVGM